jgi:hypothetical protein
MTYEELKKTIEELPKDRQKDTVTIFDTNSCEFYPAKGTWKTDHVNDVLDGHHLVVEF